MSYFVKNVNESEYESDSEDGRLASLDALRYALSTAPFFRQISHQTSDQCGDEPDKCAILVENLSFSYDKELILNRINVEVPKGRIYALIGMS